LLREGMAAWMAGRTAPLGMPAYADWVRGITSALDHVRQSHSGNVVVFSSGGPISTAVGHVLGTAAQTTIELNLRMRNSAITELAFTPKRHMLVSFNHLPHLDRPDRAHWVTYS
jgi:broad specificity phosphatase PhoE